MLPCLVLSTEELSSFVIHLMYYSIVLATESFVALCCHKFFAIRLYFQRCDSQRKKALTITVNTWSLFFMFIRSQLHCIVIQATPHLHQQIILQLSFSMLKSEKPFPTMLLQTYKTPPERFRVDNKFCLFLQPALLGPSKVWVNFLPLIFHENSTL